MTLSLVLLELLRVLFRFALAALCFRLLRSTWLATRSDATTFDRERDHEAPTVVVQLPVKNEYFVASRVLRAVAALDYPRDRLEIQVIDQSDDATVHRVAEVVREIERAGIRITLLRRKPDDGCKSDSLAEGLAHTTGEFVAIFDADCVPAPDFLRRVLPRFEAGVGLVQARLSFENRSRSILTRAQAQLLDGLMLVDQAAEANRPGGTMHFNGTAGVWRRACLEDAGGWRRGSITEDIDISCRAISAGWRLVHAPDVEVSAELPDTMSAFRVQQRRWTRGQMHVLRENLRTICSRAPLAQRARSIVHTARRSIFLALAILLVTWPLTTFNVVRPLVRYSMTHDVILFAAVMLSASAFLLRAQQLARRSLWPEVIVLPATIALFFGMSVGCALSIFAGLGREKSSFVRTPKSRPTDDVLAPHYGSRLDAISALEVFVAFAYAAFAVAAAERGLYLHACWSVFVSVAYAWVGGGAVIESVATSSVATYRAVAARSDAHD